MASLRERRVPLAGPALAPAGLEARADCPLGAFPGSVLLQIGQRSMKRLCRQKVGTAGGHLGGLGCSFAENDRAGRAPAQLVVDLLLGGADARARVAGWSLATRVRIAVSGQALVV